MNPHEQAARFARSLGRCQSSEAHFDLPFRELAEAINYSIWPKLASPD